MAKKAVKVSQANLNDAEADTISRGRKAWAELKKSHDWQRWVTVGEALLVGRAYALRESRSTEPTGRGYNTAFGNWLHKYGFDQIDKVTRHRLLKLMEPDVRAEVEKWRASLTISERARCNHPSTMMRFLKKAKHEFAGSKPRGESGTIKEHAAELEDANANLEARIERLEDALQACREETARLKAENAELKAKLKET